MKTLINRIVHKICQYTVVLGLVLISQDVFAQATDRVNLHYQHFANTQGVSNHDVSGKVNHQLLLDDDGENLLTIGLGFSHTELEDSQQTGPDRSRQLRTIVPEFSLMKLLTEEYSMVLTLRPGFYGSLEGSLGDDFRLEGGLVFTKFMSANLTMGLGLGRGSNFGRDLVVPLFQFVWFANEKVIVRGLLPVRASAWYIPSPDWEFGLIYRLQGSLYNVEGDTNIAGAKRLGFAHAHIGLAARYKLFGTNFISAEAGYTALRRYQWDNEDDVSFKISEDPFFERDVDGVPYIRVGWVQKF